MSRNVWLKRLGYKPNPNLFDDISTCPICTQDKDAMKFTTKEIMHMQRHLRKPIVPR